MKAYPKKIYVVQEKDGDETYLVASEDAGTLAEKGVAVPAAEYVLFRAGVVIEAKIRVR